MTSALPDSLLTLPTRYGSWRLASWNRVQSEVRYRLPIVLGASFLAFALILLGCLAFWQQRKAIRLAEQRVSFVNQVSHELRSPLTNILLNTDLACDSLNGSHPKATQRLGLVQQEAGRLNRLIENVLSFSATERGDDNGQAIPCNPDAVVEEVLSQFSPALERKGIKVQFDRGCPESILLDVDAVSQILANLISNVEKYAADGKWLGIQSSTHDGQCHIRVSDRGPGIRAGDQARIFESFQRLDSSLTEGVSGTGLGLSIARSLAERLGGDLDLIATESGACFELRLPATQVESV